MDYICDIELRYFHVTKTHEVQTAVNQFKKKCKAAMILS